MRLGTIFTTFVLACVATAIVNGQDDAPKKKKGNRGRMVTFDQAKNADGKVTKDSYLAASTKDVSDDKKDKATERATGMWTRIADAAKGAGADADKGLSNDEYDAAIQKVRDSFKGKRKKQDAPAPTT